MRVLCIFGTRPEAIKMAPVLRELRRHSGAVKTKVCVTAQHRKMLDQVLELFKITPDHDLHIMQENQPLSYVTGQVLRKVEGVLTSERPDWVLVQGDTTTAMAASLAAYYQRVRIGHVEAGLRTRNKFHPFPEEINRRMGDILADLCFAPTEGARQNLLNEGIPPSAIRVTGNTVVDALMWVRELNRRRAPVLPDGLQGRLERTRLVLITGHRRESFGPPFEAICRAIRELAERFPDLSFVYPVHLNPNVQRPARRILDGQPNIHLIDPLPYGSFVWLMERADVILTDSGGIQEEAPSLGKLVLVMRGTTERPEGIATGNTRVVGTDQRRIVEETARLLEDSAHSATVEEVRNPYGDGRAASRIVEAILA